MISEKIVFSENPSVYLETYAIVDPMIPPKDAMLIFPGGGYASLCGHREGECIAFEYASRGVNAFVLYYSLGPENRYPSQLLDAARAIKYIRDNAERYGINPERIFTVGFSAGGHLCGTLATKHRIAEQLLGFEENAARPTGSVYSYPVVTANYPTHGGSFFHLLGKKPEDMTEEDKKFHSLECNVTDKTPPAFIWHTATDAAVPVFGSIHLAEAYVKAGVTVALHIYPYGPHGIALANLQTSVGNPEYIQPLAEGWLADSVEWMKTIPNS